jgi:lactoylglutathione lyase
VKTIFVAYRVTDLERSLDFYTTLGYVDLGRVTFDDGDSLAVLKFPHEPVATLARVHRPDLGRVDVGGFVVPVVRRVKPQQVASWATKIRV